MKNMRNAKWIEDIEQLSQELPIRHANLFFSLEKEEFYKQIEILKSNIEILDNYEIQVEVGKIVASVKDAHTYVHMHVRYVCPFNMYWFNDGLYITSVYTEYKAILGRKIIAINDLPIEEVSNNLSSIISFENMNYFKALLPKYLPAVELLYGLGIVNDINNLKLTYEESENQLKYINISPLLINEIDNLEMVELEGKCNDGTLPLYRQHINENYCFKYLDKNKIIYFKYNKCRERENKKIEDFINELIDFIENNEIEKLVIDLRDNSGGNSSLLDPFIEYLANNQKLNMEGKLFVIIGRETFSSALLNALSLKEKTKAIFLGEPTGGKPNCYGEVEKFTLRNYGLTIFYSTQYYDVIGDDSVMTLVPDVKIEVTIEDYINRVDPVFEYINNLL